MAVNELFDLSGKVAVVTGAGGGLGAAIARTLAEAGASVAVVYHTNQDGADGVVSDIEAKGGKALSIQADVTDPEAVEKLFNVVTSDLGPIGILANNAGTYPVTGLLDMSVEDWDGMIASNLRSTFLCTQAAAKRMQNQGGAIVNIASIAATSSFDGHSHYSAAKAGVVAFTRASANELGGQNIRVNAVSPGLIHREGLEDDWPEGVARWRAKAPLVELGQADDIANACLYLASPASRWVSGINLVVDGGMSAAMLF